MLNVRCLQSASGGFDVQSFRYSIFRGLLYFPIIRPLSTGRFLATVPPCFQPFDMIYFLKLVAATILRTSGLDLSLCHLQLVQHDPQS